MFLWGIEKEHRPEEDLFIYLFIYLFIFYLSLNLVIYLFIYLFIYLGYRCEKCLLIYIMS